MDRAGDSAGDDDLVRFGHSSLLQFLSHRSLSKQLPVAEGLLYLRRRFLGLSSSAKADDPVILTGRGLATHQKQSTTGGYWMPRLCGHDGGISTTPALTAAKS
jgi:hypothetical protein